MRFATCSKDGEIFYGAVGETGMIALSPHFPQWPSLREVISCNGLGELEKFAANQSVTHPEGTYAYEIPIPAPEKIICVGVNFPERNSEYRDGQAPAGNMSLFVRFPRSFTGHRRPLIRPRASRLLDYEGEIAVIIGTGGRHIGRKDAYRHIAAVTLCNEGTVRDWVRHAKFNVTQGKNFESSGSMGPWIVPLAAPDLLENARITTRVNGEVRQDDLVSRMLYPIPRQIEYISTFTTLVPGDIIVTGTPAGAGARLEPPLYLQPGDTVEVECEGIGCLVNGVEDEA
jgi:2-keto-4-pentenoate hydratase/2-oxohepta-3-ene-1,7-dioic acid hydratase in catechol pathway